MRKRCQEHIFAAVKRNIHHINFIVSIWTSKSTKFLIIIEAFFTAPGICSKPHQFFCSRILKLLAVNSSKVLVVDSFKIPSGCHCSFREPFAPRSFFRFAFESGPRIKTRSAIAPRPVLAPVCTSKTASTNLKTLEPSVQVSLLTFYRLEVERAQFLTFGYQAWTRSYKIF